MFSSDSRVCFPCSWPPASTGLQPCCTPCFGSTCTSPSCLRTCWTTAGKAAARPALCLSRSSNWRHFRSVTCNAVGDSTVKPRNQNDMSSRPHDCMVPLFPNSCHICHGIFKSSSRSLLFPFLSLGKPKHQQLCVPPDPWDRLETDDKNTWDPQGHWVSAIPWQVL